jgi:putative DNA primase/helicase
MWENYSGVVADMQAAGLLIDGGLAVDTGKTARTKIDGDREHRGWYRLSTMEIDGRAYLVGAFGVWRGNDNGKVSVKPPRGVRVSSDQRAAIHARVRADAAKAAAARKAEGDRAAQKAAAAWRAYEPTGFSDYLHRKGVGAHGVRFHPAGTLAVPMMDERGKIWGLQIIRGRGRGGKLEKQYWPRGLLKQGRYHLIGGSPRGVLLLAEGYATAASLHEATGLSVVVCFDAGNLRPVAEVVAREYRGARLLICADDDYRTEGNPGVTAAQAAAFAVDGAVLAPVFSADRPADRKGPTDFNDLAQLEGAAVVRAQVDARLSELGWSAGGAPPRLPTDQGGGGMVPRLTVDEAAARFWGTYGMGGKALFDAVEHRIVHKDDVLNLLPRHGWEELRAAPGWRVARDWEIGFDPTGRDERIRCNLYAGWPTVPKAGQCQCLLELLEYLCSGETNVAPGSLYQWVLRWLAYPIQNPGAKMLTSVIVHGGQGTGKSLFFETIVKIYGEYGRVLGQEALEDKFNADWAEKKLFILADEVLARSDMYHVKNRLKGFITGDTIRVNPKNVAAHNERNHMNIAFLSNERQASVLEGDDRRYCVIWTPPKLSLEFFDGVLAELAAGGREALHWHLLHEVDLGDFGPSSLPPMTDSKRDLIAQTVSSEERFVEEWRMLEVEINGQTLPFCPCLGTDLYRAYQIWCDRHGERRRRMQDLIGYCNKRPGWSAGRPERTWRTFQDRTNMNRKMVVPAAGEIAAALAHDDQDIMAPLVADRFESKTAWLTAGFWAVSQILGGAS